MAVMERRLQLLLDEQRYQLVAAEAAQTNRSVAAVIRDAIDRRYDDDLSSRAEAARHLLAMTEDNVDEEQAADARRLKDEWDADLLARLDRASR